MKRLITAAIATSLLASSAMPVAAQTYTQSQQEYERQMRDYEVNRSQYDRDRAEYDRRYGAGSYDRYNSRPAPQYNTPAPAPYRDDRYDNRNDDRYGRNDRDDPYSRYVSSPCEQRYNNQNPNRTGNTVIGALIGGALGAAVAGDSSTTEGAVLGALAGGVLGNNVGNNNTSSYDRYAAKCDASGYYYTFDQTTPYRESTRYRNNRSGRYDNTYYTRQRCRLAVAPADMSGRVEYRYVRVCPDRNNRYRITS